MSKKLKTGPKITRNIIQEHANEIAGAASVKIKVIRRKQLFQHCFTQLHIETKNKNRGCVAFAY